MLKTANMYIILKTHQGQTGTEEGGTRVADPDTQTGTEEGGTRVADPDPQI